MIAGSPGAQRFGFAALRRLRFAAQTYDGVGIISVRLVHPECRGENVENQKDRRSKRRRAKEAERPISSAYPVIDNDLARDNIENDLTQADLQDV